MTAQEILESEKRSRENLFDIHFYMEGNFWRAYEWSAYLCRNFPSSLNENERLKVLKKVTKDCQEGYVLVGLQLPSFKKYFPSVMDDENLFEIKDKHIILHVKSFFDEEKFLEYEKILNEWKSNIQLSANEKKKIKNLNSGKISVEKTEDLSIDSLIDKIISYPIENKNLIETLQFLSYIRNKFLKIKNEKMNS